VERPYQGEPFASLRRRILERVEDDAAAVIAVTGAPDGGCRAICRRIATELGQSRLVLSLDLLQESGGATLPQRLCRAAGSVEEPSEETSLDALIERLGEERRQQRLLPLVVLENVAVPHPAIPDLARIVGAALWTRSFKVLLAGAADLPGSLGRAGVDFQGEPVPEIQVRPLDREEVAGYVRGWLEATLAPRAPRVIASPDALLLLALRSEGALGRLDRIAQNMLMLAAAERGRILSSWHAWAAPDQELWSEMRPPPALPRRPDAWPPPEVIDVIDACRRGAGMPPYPRVSSRREGSARPAGADGPSSHLPAVETDSHGGNAWRT
jgi:hypothetical protein